MPLALQLVYAYIFLIAAGGQGEEETVSHGVDLLMENPVQTLPSVFLWPHSGCNCRCVMCDIWTDRSRTMVDTGHVREWAAEWQDLGVRCVTLTGGEALMHRDLWEICRELRDHGFLIFLLSTGLTLGRHAAEVVRYCDAVSVSLDGPPDVHNAVRRVPRAFDRLRDSVQRLRGYRPDFPVFGRSAVHRWNFRHLRQTVRCARDDLALNHISFLATDVTSEGFNRPGGWDEQRQEGLVLAAEDLPDLAAELDALERDCVADFARRFIAEPPDVLRARLLEFYRAHHGLTEFPYFACNAPWGSAVVEPDGQVRPCFFQPAYGNIHEAGSFTAVLNSPRAVAFRERLDVRTDPICQRCVCQQTIGR